MSRKPTITSQKKFSFSYKTAKQEFLGIKIRESVVTFATGCAGTGKTFIAMAEGLRLLRNPNSGIRKIILCRPAVEACGEKLGFLPGSLDDKMEPYFQHIHDICGELLTEQEIYHLIRSDSFEVKPLAYLRGNTFKNAFVVLDEAQNVNAKQMLMFLTRLGEGSKIVICGDPIQSDQKESCLDKFQQALWDEPDFAFVDFTVRDIVRHELIGRIIEKCQHIK